MIEVMIFDNNTNSNINNIDEIEDKKTVITNQFTDNLINLLSVIDILFIFIKHIKLI